MSESTPEATQPGPRFAVVWPSLAVRDPSGARTVLRRGDSVPAAVPLATCQLLAGVGALQTVDDALPDMPTRPAARAPMRVDPAVSGQVPDGAPPPPLPVKSAPKATWTAWAIDHGGIAAAAAAAMTKDELIAALTTQEPTTTDPAAGAGDAVTGALAGDAGDEAAGDGAEEEEGDVPPSLPVNEGAADAGDGTDDPDTVSDVAPSDTTEQPGAQPAAGG